MGSECGTHRGTTPTHTTRCKHSGQPSFTALFSALVLLAVAVALTALNAQSQFFTTATAEAEFGSGGELVVSSSPLLRNRRGLYVQIYTLKCGQLSLDSPSLAGAGQQFRLIIDDDWAGGPTPPYADGKPTGQISALIRFLNKYEYTALSFYNMWAVLGSPSDLTPKFRSMMRRLRAEVPSLRHVEGISDETVEMWRRMAVYQNASAAANAFDEMFDGFVTEIEFWNGQSTATELVSCLAQMQTEFRPAWRSTPSVSDPNGAPIPRRPHYLIYIGTNIRNDNMIETLINATLLGPAEEDSTNSNQISGGGRIDAYMLAAYVTQPASVENSIVGTGRTLARLFSASLARTVTQGLAPPSVLEAIANHTAAADARGENPPSLAPAFAPYLPQFGVLLSAEGVAFAAGDEYFMGDWLSTYCATNANATAATPIAAGEAASRASLDGATIAITVPNVTVTGGGSSPSLGTPSSYALTLPFATAAGAGLIGFQWYEYIFAGLYTVNDTTVRAVTTTAAPTTTAATATPSSATTTTSSTAPATTTAAPPPLHGCTGATLHSQRTAVSPLTGLVLWNTAGSATYKAYGDSVSLEFRYFGYEDVVAGYNSTTGAITFHWDPIDAALSSTKGRGHQLIVRFRDQSPNEGALKNTSDPEGSYYVPTFVPAYIKAAAGYSETRQPLSDDDRSSIDGIPSNAKVWYYFPDFTHPLLLDFYPAFFTALAARYDADARLGYLQFGFGNWGEFHLYPYTVTLGVNFPPKAYTASLLATVVGAFALTPVQLSIDAAGTSYTDFAKSLDVLRLNFGLMDDSFMIRSHASYNAKVLNGSLGTRNGTAGGPSSAPRFHSAPIGGEISYGEYPMEQFNFLDPNGLFAGTSAAMTWPMMVQRFAVTYMIANDAPNMKNKTSQRIQMTPAIFKAGSMATGYQLTIEQIRVEDISTSGDAEEKKGTIVATFGNEGVAPPYTHIYASITSPQNSSSGGPRTVTTNTTVSLRGLLRGELREVSFNNVDVSRLASEPLDVTLGGPKLYGAVPFAAACTYYAAPVTTTSATTTTTTTSTATTESPTPADNSTAIPSSPSTTTEENATDDPNVTTTADGGNATPTSRETTAITETANNGTSTTEEAATTQPTLDPDPNATTTATTTATTDDGSNETTTTSINNVTTTGAATTTHEVTVTTTHHPAPTTTGANESGGGNASEEDGGGDDGLSDSSIIAIAVVCGVAGAAILVGGAVAAYSLLVRPRRMHPTYDDNIINMIALEHV